MLVERNDQRTVQVRYFHVKWYDGTSLIDRSIRSNGYRNSALVVEFTMNRMICATNFARWIVIPQI